MATTETVIPWWRSHRIGGFELGYFLILLGIVLASLATNSVTPGLVGVLPVLMVIGALFDEVGSRTPIVRGYLGGGPIVVIFGAAACATYLSIGRPSFELITSFMTQGGFLDFYIAALITGSILGMSRNFLLSAALRYFPAIAGAVVVALLCAGATGWILGFGFMPAVIMIGIPIMGGGMGAGAIPISQIMAGALGVEPAEMLSRMVPAVALANALAIVAAGSLNRLGGRYPSISGNGRLLKRELAVETAGKDSRGDLVSLGTGLLMSGGFFAIGKLLALVIPVHPYALMILVVALMKAFNMVNPVYEACAASWFQFVMKNLTNALLIGIGVAYTDLSAVVAALTPSFLVMVAATVLGAIVGAAAAGHLVGFFMVEVSITAGLCMANMGGTGDVAVLSAAKRMPLIPFAQISSRLGGAFIIILVSILSTFIGK